MQRISLSPTQDVSKFGYNQNETLCWKFLILKTSPTRQEGVSDPNENLNFLTSILVQIQIERQVVKDFIQKLVSMRI